MLSEQVESVVNVHLRPYYGDEDETDGLYYIEAKVGTAAFHAYATLYARVKNKPYTLAVHRLTDGDTASTVLTESPGLVDSFDFEVKALHVDSEFYDGKCLTLMHAHKCLHGSNYRMGNRDSTGTLRRVKSLVRSS